MFYVYILQSINFPEKVYVGYTLNLSERLETHNSGGSVYAKDHKPWKMVFFCAFETKELALEFEAFLKSHAGRLFMHKRLLKN